MTRTTTTAQAAIPARPVATSGSLPAAAPLAAGSPGASLHARRPPLGHVVGVLTQTLTTVTMLLVSVAILSAAVGPAVAQQADLPVLGLPCEGCEAVFVGMPDELSWRARIAPKDEPGEPMVVRGVVYDTDGDPAPGVIVYAYHTDATGEYPRAEEYSGWARRHGELRAWVRTEERGRYRFDTIRPASYPNQSIPAHVHMHIIEPDCCTYYISSIHFADDPLLTPEDRAEMVDGRGGSGLVQPRREDGVWMVERDIRLGQGVPGYR